MVIGICGKGGVGKTTIAALVVQHLVQRGDRPVLAVDADPNSTFGEKLGLQAEITIGDLREAVRTGKSAMSVGLPKQRELEYEIEQSVVEGPGFDLVVMGRGEGPGCYCAINNMLRAFLHNLSSRYKHTVIDNEAGMEHLSRRTNDKVDLMLVVCDPTPIGLRTARRIGEMSRTLGVVRGNIGLIVNQVTEPITVAEVEAISGLKLFGEVPYDTLVRKYELEGKPLLSMPLDSPAVHSVANILKQLGV